MLTFVLYNRNDKQLIKIGNFLTVI